MIWCRELNWEIKCRKIVVNEKKEMKGILWDISMEEWAKFSLLYPKRQILKKKKKDALST